VDRFVSAPLPLAPRQLSGDFTAAELAFYDVDHSGPSFRALVFLDTPEADIETPLELDAGYAGHFVIFGHGGCVGDEGHCEVPEYYKDVFDSRPLHPLTPQTKLVDITEALRRREGGSRELVVTALPIIPGPDGPERRDVLQFSSLRLLAYD
jgi:hypothetical protein